MTPARFNECLEHLHWSAETLAGMLGRDESLTEAYSLGLTDVSVKLGMWLHTLTLAHEAAESARPNGGSRASDIRGWCSDGR
jgi:hypothetical protein